MAHMPKRLNDRFLSYVNLYCNTRCNSRCLTCAFWQQDPKVFLTPNDVAGLAQSKYVDSETWFAVQGGEFSLHTQADEILDVLANTNYVLFSNLISPRKVLQLIRRHKVAYVTVSLDGGRDGYNRIRGVDGFERVTNALLKVQELTNVSVGITITPWSEYRDYEEAANFCRTHGIDFGVNIYTNSHIYEANNPVAEYPFLTKVASDARSTFCGAYDNWKKGKLHLPCRSIREVASIAPDGTVYLCHNQKVALGNLRESSFDKIWSHEETRRLHESFASCNQCWTSCYREFDWNRFESAEGSSRPMRQHPST